MASKLNGRDWQRIAQFYAELAELRRADVSVQWKLVVEALERVIGGEAGFIIVQKRLDGNDDPLKGFRPVSLLRTFDRGDKVEAFVQDWMTEETNLLDDPFIERLMTCAGERVRALGHRHTLEPRDWDRASVRRLLEGLEVADRITGVLPLSPELELSYTFDRSRGDRHFDAREAAILEACLDGLRPMSRSILAAHGLLPGQQALTPREHELLSMLLGPMSVKEIAEELDLSAYYVRDLVKAVYKKLNVRSRPELMAIWLQG